MEIRLHGRGGQGGVTCAKILAAVYGRLGQHVQAFGDYASERSGAPVRAYTRVSESQILNRNKVYAPDHVLVLDTNLLGTESIAGMRPGGTLLLNVQEGRMPEQERFPAFRLAGVDATEIARRHGIGTRSLVIVNTTIAGAFVRIHDLPFHVLERVYEELGFASNLPAAREAWDSVLVREPLDGRTPYEAPIALSKAPTRDGVRDLTAHTQSAPTGIQTGTWRSQQPRYVKQLAPCVAWCPAGNDVVGFVQELAEGRTGAAADILARSNPLAGTCGRVCPAPCMEGCNRVEYDGAVNIRGLERLTADGERIARGSDSRPARRRHVAILGGGPAGLAASYEVARAGHFATIIEAEDELGGLLSTGIPAYRLPREVVRREIQAILDLGVRTMLGRRLGRGDLPGLLGEFDALVIATGLQRLRPLDVPGAGNPRVRQGVAFLRDVNLSTRPRLEGHVVVLGGGNTAMDCARSALRCGASRVTVAYRRTRAEMPAIDEEIEMAAEEGVAFAFQLQPVAIREHGNRLAGVVLAGVEMGEPDDSGRRRPLVMERTRDLECDHVLVALGQSADLSLLPGCWSARDGVVYESGQALPVTLAGDVFTGEGTVTHAVGSGRRSAGMALRSIGEPIPVFQRPPRSGAVPATKIRFDHYTPRPPAGEAHRSIGDRRRDFEAVSEGLPDASEAERCFACGHCIRCDTCLVYCPEGSIHRRLAGYEVDYAYCKGCGICVTECPRAGMEMVEP